MFSIGSLRFVGPKMMIKLWSFGFGVFSKILSYINSDYPFIHGAQLRTGPSRSCSLSLSLSPPPSFCADIHLLSLNGINDHTLLQGHLPFAWLRLSWPAGACGASGLAMDCPPAERAAWQGGRGPGRKKIRHLG